MRQSLLALVALTLTTGAQPVEAEILNVEYTGTFTGSWFGNYDPLVGPSASSGVSSGSYSTTPFTLTFQFDTDLAQPGYFNSSQLSTPPKDIFGFSIYPNFASVGSATLSSSLYNLSSGNFSASDTVALGSISQSATSVEIYKYGFYTSTSVNMKTQGKYVPGSILDSFQIPSGQPIGFGSFDYDYNGGAYGGGNVTLSLTAYSLDMTNTGPVPEPSTWAMLLIGFAALGLWSYVSRRRSFAV
jgi:hypothetical protein